MLKIQIIKSEAGDCLITCASRPYILPGLLFDGQPPEKTFDGSWFRLSQEPKVIEETKTVSEQDPWFQLLDSDLISDKLPECVRVEEMIDLTEEVDEDDVHAVYYYPRHDYFRRKEKWEKLGRLYELRQAPSVSKMLRLEFELDVLMTLAEIPRPSFYAEAYGSKGSGRQAPYQIKSADLRRQKLDLILFPGVMRPSMPCALSSRQMFDIVRAHVKDNIDPKFAVITSDYTFALRVCKRIKLSEPEKYTVNVNAGTRRKEKLETRYREGRDTEAIFSVRPADETQKGYEPISPLFADSEQELQSKLDEYLAGLMAFINEPVEDCPACKGRGVIYSPELPENLKTKEASNG